MADESETSQTTSPESESYDGPPEAAGPPDQALGRQHGEPEDNPQDAASLQLEAEWMRANHEGGWTPHMSEHGAGHALSPYLCLYAGFFLGPPGLLLTALLVAPKRLTIRRVGMFVGIAGLAWCLVQAGTALLFQHAAWSVLYASRAAINFVAGVAIVITWRLERPTTLLHSRRSVFHTVAIGLMQFGVYWVLSREILLMLGK
jgi:hypothetical protein